MNDPQAAPSGPTEWTRFHIRVRTDVFEAVARLAAQKQRSINWTIGELLAQAVAPSSG